MIDDRQQHPTPQKPADQVRFAEFTVDVARAGLYRAGSEIALRPKSFALLLYLVTHAGRLVSKDELLTAVWPHVVVTEDSLTRCISEIRAALGDREQTLIKTVNRRGYLFSAPLLMPKQAAPHDPVLLGARLRVWPLRSQAAAAAVVMLLCAGLVAWWAGERGLVAPRLSIVVLPFVHLGTDASQAYLADVISDDLTTALSRLRGVLLIASGSSVTLKGTEASPQDLGARLGVRYLVLGTVLPVDGRLHIGARLVDTRNAALLWSDQFDTPRHQLLQARDEIVVRLASSLNAELVRVDSQRPPLAGSRLDAEDLAMQCDAAWFHLGPLAALPSFDRCEQALRLDPDNLRALVRLATVLGNRVSRVQSPDPPADITRAQALVARALALAPDDYGAHCAKAVALEGARRLHEAIAAGERCLALNPSNAAAYRILATLHFFLGRPDKTLEYLDLGLRISPVDVQLQAFLLFKGWAHLMKQDDEEALLWLRRAGAASPENPTIQAGLVATLALTNRNAEAHAALARYLAMKATRTRTIAQWHHRPDDNPTFRQFDERFRSGLRKAGMAER